MGRVFRRGELKQAVLVVLESLGEAHGYAIMSELKARVGGGWKPSPGAIYPALLALEELGFVETADREGTRVYRPTEAGRTEARASAVAGKWASIHARAESGEERISVGSLLDTFASGSSLRRRLTNEDQRRQIDSILEQTSARIETTLNQGEDDG